MSVSTEVQRTLVKSPPELWAELSSIEGLTRHLGELGEIRITAVEPEMKVEWETDAANGVVQLKQSGWGTKVVLSVTRQTEPERVSEPEPSIELEPRTSVEPVADVEEPETEVEPDVEPKPEAEIEPDAESEHKAIVLVSELEPETEIVEPAQAPEPELDTVTSPGQGSSEPRRGFWARLFRRRAKAAQETGSKPVQQPELRPAEAVEPQPAQIEEPDPPAHPAPELAVLELEQDSHEPRAESVDQPVTEASAAQTDQHSETSASTAAGEAPDIAAELAQTEELLAEQTTAMLSAILDRLGAAHHRPFSRG